MERTYTEGQSYNDINFSGNDPLALGDYENCNFVNCNFGNATLSNITFIECSFTGCNLSMAKTSQTAFREVHFKGCKMLGLHFEHCHTFLFEVDFEDCILNLSCFYNVKLKKTRFKNSSLHEVDFTEADLSAAIFNNCDLSRAIFDNTNLEKADFISSFNYSINPDNNLMKKAKFSKLGVYGLLDKYDIEIV